MQNSVDRNAQTAAFSSQLSPGERSQAAAPTLSLPKGGGALCGMGEKFVANPVIGTGSVTINAMIPPEAKAAGIGLGP